MIGMLSRASMTCMLFEWLTALKAKDVDIADASAKIIKRLRTGKPSDPATDAWLHLHRLVALEAGTPVVRSILTGTPWQRVISQLILQQARPDLNPHMHGKHYGVCIPQRTAGVLVCSCVCANTWTKLLESRAVHLSFKNVFVARSDVRRGLETVQGSLPTCPA